MSHEVFWAEQNVYITEVILPIVITFIILLPILIALFALGLLRHYRLWRMGRPGLSVDHVWLRLKVTLWPEKNCAGILPRTDAFPYFLGKPAPDSR
jgi:hypothetical protein